MRTLRDPKRRPTHPGEILREDVLPALDMTQTELADRLGVSRLTVSDRFVQRDSMHLAAPGWNALGVIFHDIEFVLRGKLTPVTELEVIDRIAKIDWSRYNRDWFDQASPDFIDLGQIEVDDAGKSRLGKAHGGQQAISKMIAYIRKRSGIAAYVTVQPPQLLLQAAA